jgi:fatty acid desaturase
MTANVEWDARMAADASTVTHTQIPSDDYAGELPLRIDPAAIRRLSQLRPFISSAHIALEWALIVGAAWLCWHFWHPALYVLTVAFVGARQHALIVLAHEAAHWRLFRRRAVNDWVGELLLAWPFVVFTMQAYRRNHLPHHRHINTAEDPDWVRKQTPAWRFPMPALQLARMLLLDALGVGFVQFIVVASKLPAARDTDAPQARAFSRGRLAFLLATAIALSALHAWKQYLLFWVVPYVTWMQFCFHVRSIAEHFAMRGASGVYAQTRTVLPTWFDRVFILPKNANYHLEHHLFPSVPFYRLPELHRLLMEQPSYRDSAHITRGYLGVLRECTQQQ